MQDTEAAIIRKVAWRIVPFLCFAYVINALDRYNVSIAALTMNRDLGLSASAYGLAAGAYFWSYVCCQLPANLVLRKIGARAWLSLIMALWGAISATTALVTNETTFVIARILLGVAEAGYFPGVAYFLTCWFPNRHRGRMMGLFFAASATATVIGAPLSANLLRLEGVLGLAGWQWIFLAEGLPAILLAVFGYASLRNEPADAPWLTAAERTWLQGELDRESARKATHGKSVTASVVNPQIVTLIIAFVCTLYGVYCVSFFLPLIIKSMGLSNTAVGYVAALPNLCSAFGMVLISRHSDRTGERFWHVIVPVTAGALGTLAAAFLLDNVYLAMAAFCVAAAGLSSSLPLFWNLPTAYFGAATAAAGIGVINTFGNMSGYFAPQLTGLLHDATGAYVAPLLLAGALGLAAPVLIACSGIRRYLVRTATP
ncbi:MAG TPA: MFS transporter [Rhodopila sp.]|uniref:MFS transporter n=1 Tax=Rhodopila sp. TaxID=2480087 RepID=UPI002C03643B|nr:MFS transporter [Rhodopila sp.]HVY15397.1 MFS transporter [Rhodopila sp.]